MKRRAGKRPGLVARVRAMAVEIQIAIAAADGNPLRRTEVREAIATGLMRTGQIKT
jgi:hypothetical protein